MLRLDVERLEELMRAFYTLSGIRIVLFDGEKREVLAYPKENCPFCAFVKADSRLGGLCEKSDRESFARCDRTGRLHVYKCHAGLIEAAAPVISNGETLAYIMFGQILDADNPGEAPREALRPAYARIARKRMDEITASAKILDACTQYLLSNRFVAREKDDMLRALDRYIDEHIAEPIAVKDVCAYFSMGRTTLYDVLGRHLPQGVAGYVRARRIERAKQLLESTPLSVTEVADGCGFSDYNYFCRVFKKAVGQSARGYARKHQR